MARDPKNFTGEDVPALLAEHARHKRAKEDRNMLAHVLWGVLCLILLVVIIGSWVAELLH
ncbi:hypothetical protein [Variovorax sp. GB1P17]|uniref:hypothetical protein n=1 Tax=Variovorax sp. GB1P17 TaxID=3443740 RepID=UPI003F478897